VAEKIEYLVRKGNGMSKTEAWGPEPVRCGQECK
jgi:hypothetical protein